MLARGAHRWIAVACLPALAALPLSVAVSVAFAPLPLAVAFFFRDPEREVAVGVVSPADGRVRSVTAGDDAVEISIFMNLYDVHVNRCPVEGRVASVEHSPGGHLPAFSKSSDRNERVTTEIETDDGVYRVTQIAGAVARRITVYVDEADEVEAGDRLGHIAFSSRVDVRLPGYSVDDVDVEVGDSVRASETSLASRRSS